MRREFELTGEELDILIEAGKPTMVMKIGTYDPPSPQDNANYAWRKLGEKRGFDYMSVKYVPGKSNHFFTAEETPNG